MRQAPEASGGPENPCQNKLISIYKAPLNRGAKNKNILKKKFAKSRYVQILDFSGFHTARKAKKGSGKLFSQYYSA